VKAYRVHFETKHHDYIMVWAPDEDEAVAEVYPELRRLGDNVEITGIEEA